MVSVFHYLNYRSFLKETYLEKKRAKPSYSYRVFNKACGIKSPSLYKLVCDGKRDLTEKTIMQFAKGLDLPKRDAQFFQTLVRFNQAKTVAQREFYYAELTLFKEHNQVRRLNEDQLNIFFPWHNLAIYELTKLPDFRENPQWIARKLKNELTETQATESLKRLQSFGLLVPDPKTRKLKAVDKNVDTDPIAAALAVAYFHKEMLKKAIESIDRDSHTERDMSVITVALDENGFQEARKRIQEFGRELNILLSSIAKPDRVCQINFQLFPLTTTKAKPS